MAQSSIGLLLCLILIAGPMLCAAVMPGECMSWGTIGCGALSCCETTGRPSLRDRMLLTGDKMCCVQSKGGPGRCLPESNANKGPYLDCMPADSGTQKPYFQGFDGSVFDFRSPESSYINLFCDENHNVNAKLARGRGAEGSAVYMTEVGLKVKDWLNDVGELRQMVRVEVLADGSLEVELNVHPLTVDELGPSGMHSLAMNFSDMGTSLVYEYYHPVLGRTVTLRTKDYEFLIWSTPAGSPDEDGTVQPFSYLNLQVKVLTVPRSVVHGVLGQTLSGPLQKQSSGASKSGKGAKPDASEAWSFPGQGKPEDYVTKDHFNGGNTFNTYGKNSAEKQRDVLEQYQVDESALPLIAKLSHPQWHASIVT